jgi:hypothetical protein
VKISGKFNGGEVKAGGKRFIATTEKDYDPVFTYAVKVKLDLNKYDYRNQ